MFSKYKRNFVEKNNDALLFWQYIGGPLSYVIGAIVIFGLVFGGIKIYNAIETSQENAEIAASQKLAADREKIVDEYISINKDTFGEIGKKWNIGNLFFAQNDKGTYTFVFQGYIVAEIDFENKTGQSIIIYEAPKQ